LADTVKQLSPSRLQKPISTSTGFPKRQKKLQKDVWL